MGNENKVDKDIVENSASDFLPDEIRDVDRTPAIYSLEDEFALAKKNKNYGLYLFVLGFVSAVIVATVIFTTWIQSSNRSDIINISEFDDVRLKDLIDSAQGGEAKLLSSQRALNNVKLKMKTEIIESTDRFNRRREHIISAGYPKAESGRKISAARVKHNREVKAIKKKYQIQIVELQNKIAQIKKDMQIDKKAIGSSAQESGVVLNNYDKLNRIRIRSLRSGQAEDKRAMRQFHGKEVRSIVMKYNPIFSSLRLKKIINYRNYAPGISAYNLNAYSPVLERERIFSKSKFDFLRTKIDSNGILISRLNQIPYINSVSRALRQVDTLNKGIIYDYETLWKNLLNSVNKKNREISNYKYALDYILRIKPESGYVIDSRNPKSLFIYIKNVHKIKVGSTALVFRGDDEYIGKIQFFRVPGGGLKAKTVQLSGKNSIRPYDKILLNINK